MCSILLPGTYKSQVCDGHLIHPSGFLDFTQDFHDTMVVSLQGELGIIQKKPVKKLLIMLLLKILKEKSMILYKYGCKKLKQEGRSGRLQF